MIQLLQIYYGSNKPSLLSHVKIINIKSPFSLSRSTITLQLLDDLSKVFASAVLNPPLSNCLNPLRSLTSCFIFLELCP